MPSDDPMRPADEPYAGPHTVHGDIGDADMVADCLEARGATAFIAAAEAYFALLRRANERSSEDASVVPGTPHDLLDLDSDLTGARAESRIDEPDDLHQRTHLHIELFDGTLDS